MSLTPAGTGNLSAVFGAKSVEPVAGFTAELSDQPVEGGTDPQTGTVTWRTLISGDRTPSKELIVGVADMGAFGTLKAHRHEAVEFYFGLSGEGIVEIDGVRHRIAHGTAVYIPGNAEHGVIAGPDGLSFLYGFPEHAFEDVEYVFSHSAAAGDV